MNLFAKILHLSSFRIFVDLADAVLWRCPFCRDHCAVTVHLSTLFFYCIPGSPCLPPKWHTRCFPIDGNEVCERIISLLGRVRPVGDLRAAGYGYLNGHAHTSVENECKWRIGALSAGSCSLVLVTCVWMTYRLGNVSMVLIPTILHIVFGCCSVCM